MSPLYIGLLVFILFLIAGISSRIWIKHTSYPDGVDYFFSWIAPIGVELGFILLIYHAGADIYTAACKFIYEISAVIGGLGAGVSALFVGNKLIKVISLPEIRLPKLSFPKIRFQEVVIEVPKVPAYCSISDAFEE